MLFYTVGMLQDMYRHERPDWSEEKIKKKAKTVHKLLNTLDTYWKRSNRRYYDTVHILMDMLINNSSRERD